jgi:Co/Zn/Cd efflux system component
MSMSRNLSAKRPGRRHHEDYEPILAVLHREGPLSPENLEKKRGLFVSYFGAFGYHFAQEIRKESSGFLGRLGRRLPEKTGQRRRMRHNDSERFDFGSACKSLIDKGLIEVNPQGNYELTNMGSREAERSARRLENATQTLEKNFLSPTAAAKNTIVATSLLTVVKLSAGLLSGSLGLIADGVDSVVDSVSAMVVWLGVRSRRELLASLVTVLMMFVAAASVGYESASRILAIMTSTASPMSMPLVVIAVEAIALVFSLVLSVYQRVVGRTRGSLTLVSQSVDSRNHVYVAASVILGAIFSMVGVYFVDALVGAFVAARIFYDAFGLSKDALSQARGKGADLSKYQVPFERPYKTSREETLRTWILYLMEEDGLTTKEEIVESMEGVLRIGKALPLVSEFGLSPGAASDFVREFDALTMALIEAGLVRKDGERFLLTPAGRSRVDRVFRSLRYREQAQPTIPT